MIKQIKKHSCFIKQRSNSIFWIFLAALFGILSVLFFGQSINYSDRFVSDLENHIMSGITGGLNGYSMESTIVTIIYWLVGKDELRCKMWYSFTLAFLVILTPLAVATMLSHLDSIEKSRSLGVTRNRYIGFFTIFIAPLVIPHYYVWFYKNNDGVNAWHNSTLLGMRLFSIIAICFYLLIQRDLHKGKDIKFSHLIWLTVNLFASTWYKPSFFIGFAPVMAIWILVDIVDTLRSHGNVKKIKNQILLGCSVIPSVLTVFQQYWLLYGSQENVSVVLNDVNFLPLHSIKISVLLDIPIFVIALYNVRKIISDYKNGNRIYVQAGLLWFLEYFYYIIFTEVGRGGGNFSWGDKMAKFLVIALVLRLLWINLLDILKKKKEGQEIAVIDLIYIVAAGTVMIWQILCGFYWFNRILSGHYYYI